MDRLGTLKVATRTTDASPGFKAPKGISTLLSFLSLCSIYWLLLHSSEKIFAFQNTKRKKGEPKLFWPRKDRMGRNEAVQRKVDDTANFRSPKTGKIVLIDTDVCNKQVCYDLEQEQEDQTLRTIWYWSPTLNDAETRNETTNREWFAAAKAILVLRPYIESSPRAERKTH